MSNEVPADAMGIKVLVIDDSNTIRRSAEIFLKQGGHNVLLAEDGFDALSKVNDHDPDLILMDVVMPGQNGFQLTRAITRDPRFTNVPVIMCTSKNQETDKVWGMRQGARDYIVKPVDADELVAKIKTFD